MLTIAVLNQKGGVGKTTLATNLAAAAHLEGRRTILVDLDKQGSSLEWGAARPPGSPLEGLAVVKADRALPLARFREMTGGYAVALLDSPPRLDAIARASAIAADVVLVPLQPSALDLWAIEETLTLLDEADALRAELGRAPVRRLFVVNRAISASTLAREAPAALEGHDVVGTVHQRVAFPAASAAGESVLTTDADGQAAFELRRVWRALRGAA